MRFLKLGICFLMFLMCQTSGAQSVSDLNAKIASLETKVVVLETKIAMMEESNRNLNQRIDNILFNLKSNSPNSINNSVPASNNSLNNAAVSQPVTPAVSTPKPSPSSYGRCGATTKKGSQCSRSAKSNGYCWQHGGY